MQISSEILITSSSIRLKGPPDDGGVAIFSLRAEEEERVLRILFADIWWISARRR